MNLVRQNLRKETLMSYLLEDLESEFGYRMLSTLQDDFDVLEAAVRYLKENKSHLPPEDIKQIYNDFVNRHVTYQNNLQTGLPLGQYVDMCFDAWWKNIPAPRSLEEMTTEDIRNQHDINNGLQTHEDALSRVLRVQDEIAMNEQMHSDDAPCNFGYVENPVLEEKLNGRPEDMSTVFMLHFKGVTDVQYNGKLKELGVYPVDDRERAKTEKHLLNMFKDPNAITALFDNKLPLQIADIAQWCAKRLKDEVVYAQDSNTRYYLHGNKYSTVPDIKKGDPIERVLKDYFDFMHKCAYDVPPASYTLSMIERDLQKNKKTLVEAIDKAVMHVEEEFNDKVLEVGNFCTPNGFYNYTHKISDRNGLTKVTTNANFIDHFDDGTPFTENTTLNDLYNKCEGVQLFYQFITSIQPDEQTRDYLTYVIANTLTGYREHEYSYILHGPTGANGKSVLMELLQDILGDYYADYNTDSIVRGSRNEKPALAAMNLENRRLVGGREISDGSTIDGGAFKDYFSNDSYTIERKFKNPYTVKPTHTLFLPVNQMPNFGSDPAVRRRLIVIPFTQHFVMNPDPNNPNEHKLDPTILERLKAHKDEIFTFLVVWAKMGTGSKRTMTPPESVQRYGDNMVDKTDVLADFIASEGIILTEAEINNKGIPTPITHRTELFDRYIEYVKSIPGMYNPYKTYSAFIDALLLKYPQLKDTRARTKEGKQVRGAIRGIWLDPTTTISKRLENARWDKEALAPTPYPQFKENDEYREWMNENIEQIEQKENMEKSINQLEQYLEQYANGDNVKTSSQY